MIGAAKKVAAELTGGFGSDAVETDDEEGLVYELQALSVALVGDENVPQVVPDFAVFGGEEAHAASCDLVEGDAFCVVDDGFEVSEDLAFGQDGTVGRVEDVKVI